MYRSDPIELVLTALRVSKGQLTEADAAALICRSPRRFRAIFRENVGVNYRTARFRVKMEYAGEVLLETQLPIAAISSLLGYTSRDKFERSFKLLFGLTPVQYRAARFKKISTE